MECRNFEITIISASDLPDVREFGTMKVFAEVSTKEDIGSESITTPVDKVGEVNPHWNCKMSFVLPERALRRMDRDVLVIKLYCKRSLMPDKYIGEVNLSLNRLFDNRNLCGEYIEYDLYSDEYDLHSDKYNGSVGKVRISYSFGNDVVVVEKSSKLKRVLKEGVSGFMEGFVDGAVGALTGAS